MPSIVLRWLVGATLLALASCEEQPLPPSDPTKPLASGRFDRESASAALEAFGSDVRSCRDASDPPGAGHVSFTIERDGRVSNAVLDAGPYEGTRTGVCVMQKAFSVRMRPFSGGPVKVGKSFRFED